MIRVGLCGFTISMEDYPLYFPVVEVQQTFYQPPRDETMRRWIEATPAGFEFTLKAWQLVTHPGSSPTYRRMKRVLAPAEKAGCGFFQESAVVDEGYRRSIECAACSGRRRFSFSALRASRPTKSRSPGFAPSSGGSTAPQDCAFSGSRAARGGWPNAKRRGPSAPSSTSCT